MENSTCSGMGDFSFQKNSLLPLKFKQQIQQDPWKRGGFDQGWWFLRIPNTPWRAVSCSKTLMTGPPSDCLLITTPRITREKCDPMRPPNPMVRHLPLLWFLEPARTCKVAPFGWARSPSCGLRDAPIPLQMGCSPVIKYEWTISHRSFSHSNFH